MLILILEPFTLYEEEQPTLIMLLFNMFQNKEENGKLKKITFDLQSLLHINIPPI